MKKYLFILTALLLCAGLPAVGTSQDAKFEYRLTLDDVLALAQDQSLDAVRTRNTFLASYWQYRAYKANYLPSLSLTATLPDFTKQIRGIQDIDSVQGAVVRYLPDFSSRLAGGLSLRQNLPTGGNVSLSSELVRYDRFQGNFANPVSGEFYASPIYINFAQSFFGVNGFKWDKKIEPLRFEEAKRLYLQQMERVSLNAIQFFFDYAGAIQNLAIAEFNYANNDTLYKIAKGRFNIGTIGENDLLQSELNYMDASSALNEAQIGKEAAQNRLRSFLGFNELTSVEIIIPAGVPHVALNVGKVLALAKKQNPDLLAYQRQLLESDKQIAEARSAAGFQADLNVTFGLNQTSSASLQDAYNDPNDMETVNIRLSVPLLDWGRGRGRIKMARSTRDVVKNQMEQAYADFEQDVELKVRQFNMQDAQFAIAAKSDTIAQKRYDVSKRRFLIDKITITEMNNAQIDRDRSQQNYINALRNYWNIYYTIRQLSLYDYILDKPLETDFDFLVK